MPNRFGIFGQNAKPQRSGCSANEPCVKEFKECVEEVKQRYPELSTGAINQIAMQRFTRRPSEQCPLKLKNGEKSVSAPNPSFVSFVLNKVMSNNKKPDPPGIRPAETIQRSLPLRKHISVGDDLADLAALDMDDSGNLKQHHNAESALANSLTNIELEASFDCHRRNSMRLSEVLSECQSMRSSCALSECDETEDGRSEDKFTSDPGTLHEYCTELNDVQSSSAQLKDADASIGATKRQPREPKSSFEDSLRSFDEKNFRGDFSAWQRRRSSFISSRRDSSWSVSSSESFRASLGDFTAWRSSRRSLTQN